MRTGAAFLIGEARRHDPDRYLCALLAPADRRDTLIALTVFNHELARVPEVVSQPLAGMIRLQWWRDVIDELVRGASSRHHPVVESLAEALAKGRVSPHSLHALIDAREPALDRPAPDPVRLEAYAAGTSGELARIWYAALGGTASNEADGASAMGTAFGLVGLERALGDEASHLAADTESHEVTAVTAAIRQRAKALVAEGRRLAGRPSRGCMAAFLLGALVDDRLRRPDGRGRSPLAPLTLAARVLLRRP
jgi:phytoene synthase